MPKVSRKKKDNADMDFGVPSFPDIGVDQDETLQESGETKGKKGGEDANAALLASLQQQVSGLIASNEELKRTNLALMSSPGGVTAGDTTVTAPKFDMTGLPDPGLEPEKYAEAVAQRASQFVAAQQEANMRANSRRNDQENRVQTLWNDFTSQYEDYDNLERIDFVAQKVVSDMRSRGVDPEKYMFGAKETFFKDVTKKYDEIFGKPGEETDDDTGAGTTRSNDGDDVSRTAGIFGGLESGGGRSAGADNTPKSDMLSEIQERQRKSGFY